MSAKERHPPPRPLGTFLVTNQECDRQVRESLATNLLSFPPGTTSHRPTKCPPGHFPSGQQPEDSFKMSMSRLRFGQVGLYAILNKLLPSAACFSLPLPLASLCLNYC